MRWPDVADAVIAALEADDDVAAIVGGSIYLQGNREWEVPSVTMVLIADTEEERFAPVEYQLDLYTKTMPSLVMLEAAVRRVLHHDVHTEVGGLRMWSEFTAGRSFFGPETDQYFRRSLDFRFTPIRSRYVRVPVES
jgi:hypothetical protein